MALISLLRGHLGPTKPLEQCQQLERALGSSRAGSKVKRRPADQRSFRRLQGWGQPVRSDHAHKKIPTKGRDLENQVEVG